MCDDKYSVDHIELISSTDKDKDSRIDRLNRVLGYAAALADAQNDAQNNKLVFAKVISLEDDHGALTVRWNSKPTEAERKIFLTSWESHIGDGVGSLISHQHSSVISLKIMSAVAKEAKAHHKSVRDLL